MRRSYRNSQQPALTAHLGAAIAKLHGRDLPAQACAIVRRGLVDCIGVMIAGSTEPAVERVRSVLGPPWSGEARLFPDGIRCSARDAALVNGMAAHGGYCGTAVKPIALNMVSELARDAVLEGSAMDAMRHDSPAVPARDSSFTVFSVPRVLPSEPRP